MTHRVAWTLGALGSIVVASALSSCSLALSYPEVAPEDCDNARDDDLDGAVDCDDTQCFGRCAEEGASRCANGVDDDADGALDALDPRCWPFARIELERCATVRGGGWSVPPIAGIGWSGPGDYEVDPTGASMLDVVGGIHSTRQLRSVETFTGGWDGTRIDARVLLVGDPFGAVILGAGPLVIQVGTLATPRASSIGTADTDRSISSDGSELSGGWLSVSISVARSEDGVWNATLEVTPDATARTTRVSLELAPDWPVADAFALDAQLVPAFGGGVGLLGDVSVTRPDHDPCDRRVPEVTDHVFHAVARSPELSCALGEGRTGVLVSDDALTWQRARGLDGSVGGTAPVWDSDASAFRGAALVPGSDGTLTMVVGTSTDCDTWTALGPAFATPPSDPQLPRADGLLTEAGLSLGYGYLLRRERPDEPLVHETWITATRVVAGTGGPSEVRGLVRGISPDGSPGSFVTAGFVSLEAVLEPPRANPSIALAWGARVQITGVGADRVYLVGSAQPASVAMLVEQATDLVEVGSPFLAPSGVAGTFDESSILYGALRMDPVPIDGRWTGEVTYGRLEAGSARVTVHAPDAR